MTSELPARQLGRRGFIGSLSILPASIPAVAAAKPPAKIGIADGKIAAASIVETQKSIQEAEKLAAAKKWDALEDLFEASAVAGFESQMTKVVNSEGLLTPEDIKEIGTIRRYGLAADFIIMAGAAKAELAGDEDGTINGKEVQRLLKLANGSVAEIVQILKNNRAI
eukprot:CAMPEP_0172627818 /NCGR_PEP_ID=MMETSP1068-20121228/158365_1 /TAXON_ID=35684 /ORGANISM="Pseudopedinella elastica, Strain CCMP716" /LENGTH=166 /DNA_ID=CAMNT_0013437825 /DNA_START=134 /DNA_END=634 /DNA_ORIENTATION=+